MEAICTKKFSENEIKNEIKKLNADVDTLFNKITDVKFTMEKSHFELIMAIEPKLTSAIEKEVSACEKCSK